MLSIAICDDEIQITGKIENLVRKIANKNFVDVETEVFWNGEWLLDAIIKDSKFDIIYLDIEMPKEDGISVAKRIRKYDKNVLIIYVTSHENHMRDSFSVRPFQFLVKPVSEEQMETCFKAAFNDINNADFYFRYSYKRISYKVPLRDILYFESNRRKISIVTEKDTYELYEKLNEIEKSLKNCKMPFLRVHQSFLVNYRHVDGGLSISEVANSGNIVIDSLLGYWYVTAQKKGIDFSLDIKIPMKMEFKGADICLILGNLLENAVEAAERVKKKKYIKIQMKYDKGNLLIFLMNSYQGRLIKMKDERLKSTKSDAGNHGVGLPSVYRAAAKYNGTVTVDDSIPERFLVRVVLYGEKE